MLRLPLREPVQALMCEMKRSRSVSLHLRCNHGFGADGKAIPKARELHGACAIDYYVQSLKQIGSEPGTMCYIFSDNVEWVKSNLQLSIPHRYIADICPCSDLEEMQLMASCQHHVISNSTFSWWGAWLGLNPGKIVVAPRIWMRGMPESSVDIYPKSWLRI